MKYILATKGEWSDLKVKLRSKYTFLMPNDLEYGEGTHEEMISDLRTKLGKTKQEFTKILNSL